MFGTCMRHRETGTDYRRHPFFAEHTLRDFLRIESRGVSCEEPCQFGDGFCAVSALVPLMMLPSARKL